MACLIYFQKDFVSIAKYLNTNLLFRTKNWTGANLSIGTNWKNCCGCPWKDDGEGDEGSSAWFKL